MRVETVASPFSIDNPIMAVAEANPETLSMGAMKDTIRMTVMVVETTITPTEEVMTMSKTMATPTTIHMKKNTPHITAATSGNMNVKRRTAKKQDAKQAMTSVQKIARALPPTHITAATNGNTNAKQCLMVVQTATTTKLLAVTNAKKNQKLTTVATDLSAKRQLNANWDVN